MAIMTDIKRGFDRMFGITPFFKSNHTWVNILTMCLTVVCFIMYADQMGSTHELAYGSIVFLLVLLDIGSGLMGERNSWQETTRFERMLQEAFRMVFIFIIPTLSVNQFLKSDLSVYLLMAICAVPTTYVLPFMRTYFGRQNLYINTLKISVFLNLLVSIRTTFFGICAAIAILFSWSLKNRNMRLLLLLTRAGASYLIYLTLCIVAVPRCTLNPGGRGPVYPDPCDTPEEACDLFRSYYSFS